MPPTGALLDAVFGLPLVETPPPDTVVPGVPLLVDVAPPGVALVDDTDAVVPVPGV